MRTRFHLAITAGAYATVASSLALLLVSGFPPLWILVAPLLSTTTMIGGPFAVGLIAGIVYFRRDLKNVRLQEGLCTGCGYDLTGNESGACPECGSAHCV